MNQEIQPLFEVDAMKAAVGGTPDPEVAALPKRRQFSAAYKRRIVGAADACQVPGGIGTLLRREGLYSSHLTHWRKEVEASEQAARPQAGSRQGRVAPQRSSGARGDSVAAEAGAGRADHRGPKKTMRTAGAAHGRGALAMNTAMEVAPQVGIACAGRDRRSDKRTNAKLDLDRVTTPKTDTAGRGCSGFNPLARHDTELLQTLMAGEHCLRGFTSHDIRARLASSVHLRTCRHDPKKESPKVSRTFRRFHAQALIAKIPRTRRWRVTLYGRRVMGTLLYLRDHHFPKAYSKIAA